jgi:hypothetical protein
MFIVGMEGGVYVSLFIGSLYVNKNVHLPSKLSCFLVSELKLVAWLTTIDGIVCNILFVRP